MRKRQRLPQSPPSLHLLENIDMLQFRCRIQQHDVAAPVRRNTSHNRELLLHVGDAAYIADLAHGEDGLLTL